jgi:hypothetical protein
MNRLKVNKLLKVQITAVFICIGIMQNTCCFCAQNMENLCRAQILADLSKLNCIRISTCTNVVGTK